MSVTKPHSTEVVPVPREPPEERGSLDISTTALRKIAEHAADLVYGSARAKRRIGGAEEGASARVSGPEQELRIQLDLALRYPVPIRQTVDSVREQVAGELSRLAACTVRDIAVHISALVPERRSRRVE